MKMDELRALAEAATDPRFGWHNAAYLRAFIDDDDAPVFDIADAAYIAAASPDVILALLDRLAAAETLDVERLRAAIAAVEEVYPPRYAHDERARDIAAAYAALAKSEAEA